MLCNVMGGGGTFSHSLHSHCRYRDTVCALRDFYRQSVICTGQPGWSTVCIYAYTPVFLKRVLGDPQAVYISAVAGGGARRWSIGGPQGPGSETLIQTHLYGGFLLKGWRRRVGQRGRTTGLRLEAPPPQLSPPPHGGGAPCGKCQA